MHMNLEPVLVNPAPLFLRSLMFNEKLRAAPPSEFWELAHPVALQASGFDPTTHSRSVITEKICGITRPTSGKVVPQDEVFQNVINLFADPGFKARAIRSVTISGVGRLTQFAFVWAVDAPHCGPERAWHRVWARVNVCVCV